ncbi:MAG: hypothetical protein PUP92_24945 [Rhizonema sp. PD38]|nr:hypothetical protein [Rhizonema sp. PD38]
MLEKFIVSPPCLVRQCIISVTLIVKPIEKIESELSRIGRYNAETFRSSRLFLLSLPDEILDALRRGEIEYTKAQVIARVKPEQQRSELLNKAITENLPLKEIKTRVQQLKSKTEEPPERILVERLNEISNAIRWMRGLKPLIYRHCGFSESVQGNFVGLRATFRKKWRKLLRSESKKLYLVSVSGMALCSTDLGSIP